MKFATPETSSDRARLMTRLQEFVAAGRLVPPLALDELQQQARLFVTERREYEQYLDLVTVLINNIVWEGTIAAIPYERRVLLMPQCLRSSADCRGELDEFGLLCAECGACPIGAVQAEAESLGYIVLVAEGTTVVTRLLESGTVDAVIGVSCLASLEKMFSRMAADAIPGIAVPLVFDGCVDTRVDLDWLMRAVRLSADFGQWFGQAEINALREDVGAWFEAGCLVRSMGDDSSRTWKIAVEWLAKTGKRWRPFLVAAVFRALGNLDAELPDMLRDVAIAVECFHKASLVHDDIEDEDDCRYGEPALHREHGVPVAVNIGDLLIGEGYRMIAGCGADAEMIARMMSVAARAHQRLCIGQGEELLGLKHDMPLPQDQVIEIFRNKTSPAFAVALELGAICAQAGNDVLPILARFSDAFGVAYQIQDDIHDFRAAVSGRDDADIRFSIILALALEVADADAGSRIIRAWRDHGFTPRVLELVSSLKPEDKARQLCEHYKHQAVRALMPLRNAPLKSLLRKVVGRIVCESEPG